MPPAPLHTPRTATHTGRNSTMQPQCTRRAAACQPRAARRAKVCASSLALLWMWTHVICQPAEYARARAWSRRVANMGSRNRPAPCACRTTGAQVAEDHGGPRASRRVYEGFADEHARLAFRLQVAGVGREAPRQLFRCIVARMPENRRRTGGCAVRAPHAEHRACCQRDPAEAVVTPTGGGRGL